MRSSRRRRRWPPASRRLRRRRTRCRSRRRPRRSNCRQGNKGCRDGWNVGSGTRTSRDCARGKRRPEEPPLAAPRTALDSAGARPVNRADLLLHLVHRRHLDLGLGRDRPKSGESWGRELRSDRPGPDLLGHHPSHDRVLRCHFRHADRPRPDLRRAPALESEARRRLQGDHLHSRRPRSGHHGAGLPGDICARRPVQLAARAHRARLPGAAVARPGKHRPSGDHGRHRVAVDRSHLRALFRGNGADRPVHSRGGPDGRRRQLPHAGQHHLAQRSGHDARDGDPERHWSSQDIRRALPHHRGRPELRHGVPRHLHLSQDNPTVARRLRRGPVDHPAGAGPGHGAHFAGPRRGTKGGSLMFEVRTRWGRILLQVVVTLLVLPFLFPLIAMVQGSLAGDGWANYSAVLAVPGLWRFFLNTVVIAAGVIAIVYVVTMLAALQVPFSVLLARTFVHGIPDELFEAARVDGGSAISGFRHLVIPLTRPIAAAILIFTLIGAWNNYLFPLVFLQSPEMQPITLVPQFFVGQFSNDQTKILASAVIIAIPEVIAYLCLQRMFERGLAAGAIK